ncbi:uncharacterized protein LOC130712813 [Lotus japonicus]|uniref:uncharacterized protein LOC130712813 n=1 Tax=Lotus japonicus TaxID=34305 RepID=UPI00258ABFF4|nr:uncharacterized protein LOC130712813 [Lotus japonicus]
MHGKINACWLVGDAPMVFSEDIVKQFGTVHVSDLMLPGSLVWNKPLIEFVCCPPTASAILAMPLPLVPRMDIFYWPWTPDGLYSTKFGYQFLRREDESGHGSSSHAPSLPSACWKGLWKAPTLPRRRETAWRACLGVLPVNTILHARGLAVDPVCPRCPDEVETIEHALLCCLMARMVWFASPLVYATVEQVLKRVSTLLPPSDLQPVMQRSSRSLPPVWSRPAVGVFKVNLDAALQQNGEAGGGLIARDSYGEVIAAACRLLGPVLAPSIAEALALRWAMLMAKDLGLRRVAFETDCLVLFDVWSRTNGSSILDSIVMDCRYLLPNFDVFSFLFVRRSGNCAADALAHLSFSYRDFVCLEEVPQEVLDIVQYDVMTSRPSFSS